MRRATIAARLGASLVALMMLGGSASAAPSSPVPRIGHIDLKSFAAPVLTGVDADLRLVVAVGGTTVFLIDADNLRLRNRIELPFEVGQRITLDPKRHLLFVPPSHPLPPDAAWLEPPSIAVFDLVTRSIRTTFTFPAAYGGNMVDATGLFARDSKLYVITDIVPSYEQALHRFTVHQLDIEKMLSAPASAIDWSYDLDACNDVPNGANRYGFVHRSAREDFLYFACDTGFWGASNGVMRLNLMPGGSPGDTSQFVPEFHAFGGGLGDGFVTADPANDRVLIFATAAGKQKFYVFDVPSRAWIGSVPLGNNNLGGGGFDASTGRIYATQLPGGLLLTEGNWVPTPQGAYYPTDGTVAPGQMAFDPKTRRLFLPSTRKSKDGILFDRVLVYRDGVPPQPPPQLENPDLRTQNVPEVPGETESALSGGGSAYGMRYIVAGGIQNKYNGGVWPYILTINNSYSSVFQQFDQEQNPPFKPGGSARMFFFGRVADLFIDDGTASAKSISSDADAVTRGDIAQLRDVFANTVFAEDPNMAAAKAALKEAIDWPYREADCVDFGGEDDRKVGQESGARTECDHTTPSASAWARAVPELGDGPIKVAYAWSKVSGLRDPKRGTVVRSEAIARGVDIAGLISIGEISSVGETWAFGRPGTARSPLVRAIKEAVIRDTSGNEVYSCGFGDRPCDVFQFVTAANRVLPARLKVEVPLPEADPAIVKTPGGAQGIVAKSGNQFWSDFNSFGESSYEVPALTVTFNDDAFPHIVQLAGVTADAHYTVNRVGGIPPVGGGETGGNATAGPPYPGFLTPPQPDYPAPAPPAPPQGPAYYVRRTVEGISFVMSKPREGLLLAVAWLLAGAPAYLARRRRALASVKEGP